VTLGELVSLPPGGDVHWVLDFKARPVSLQLLDAEGKPLAHREVKLIADVPNHWARGIPAADGWITWPALAHGTLSLRVFPTTRQLAFDQGTVRTEQEWEATAVSLEPLVVVPGRGPQVFERRVPAK
jgi:hypothetical protein